jgi:hypothetical protein
MLDVILKQQTAEDHSPGGLLILSGKTFIYHTIR